jgi:hypothetical protein
MKEEEGRGGIVSSLSLISSYENISNSALSKKRKRDWEKRKKKRKRKKEGYV